MTVSPVAANTVVASADAAKQAKLADAAQQFEAMMMQELLKPFSGGQDNGFGGQDGDAGANTMSSFGTEAMAKAIAKSGGLGIAKQVIRQVTQEGRRVDGKKS